MIYKQLSFSITTTTEEERSVVRYRNLSVEEALEMEDLLHKAAGVRSLRKELNRKIGNYYDHDFERTLFSRSKNNFSKIRKVGKINKKRARAQKLSIVSQ